MKLHAIYPTTFKARTWASAWRLHFRGMIRTFALACVLLLVGQPALAFKAPAFQGDVLDDAGLLSEADRQTLRDRIRTLRVSDDIWAAIYIVPNLQETTIEEAAVTTFEKWKIGEKGKDNGVLILVAPNERKTRIEVGYGLEGTLTDALSKRIIDQYYVPAFREQRFTEGLLQGFDIIAQARRGEMPPPVSPPASAQREVNWDGAGTRFLWSIGLNLIPVGLYAAAYAYGRGRGRTRYESSDFRTVLVIFLFIGFVFGLFQAVFGAAFPDDPEIVTGILWGNGLFAAVFGIPFMLKARRFFSGTAYRQHQVASRSSGSISGRSSTAWESSRSSSSSSSDSDSSSSSGGSSGGGGSSGDW